MPGYAFCVSSEKTSLSAQIFRKQKYPIEIEMVSTKQNLKKAFVQASTADEVLLSCTDECGVSTATTEKLRRTFLQFLTSVFLALLQEGSFRFSAGTSDLSLAIGVPSYSLAHPPVPVAPGSLQSRASESPMHGSWLAQPGSEQPFSV